MESQLFYETSLCFMKRQVWRVSYFFIKRLTKIETSSIFLNSHQKILENSRKFRFQIFTQKILELEFSLYETIFSKLNHHYYNLSLYILIYTTHTHTHTHTHIYIYILLYKVQFNKAKLGNYTKPTCGLGQDYFAYPCFKKCHLTYLR